MADRTFTVFAFRAAEDPPETDERRHGIPAWRISHACEWALSRGFDTILIQQTDEPASSDRLSTHHVCSDSECPGGCE
jgi:hypothetical protein